MFQNKLYTLEGAHLMDYQIDRALIDQKDESKGYKVMFAAEIVNSDFSEKCFTFFKKPEDESKTLFLFDIEVDLSNKLDSKDATKKENIIVGETNIDFEKASDASEYLTNLFETLQRAAFIYSESLKAREAGKVKVKG